MNLHDTGLQMLANVASNHLVSGEEAARYGNGHPNIVPYRTYAASDGELALAVGNDGQFALLAGEVGHPEWAEDPRFATNPERVRNRDLVDEMVGEVIVSRARAEWVELFDRVGIPSGPINRVSEALSSPQALAREMVTDLAGSFRTLGLPIEMSATPVFDPSRATDARSRHRCGARGVGLFGRGDLCDAGGWGGVTDRPKAEKSSPNRQQGYGFCRGGLVG